MPELYPNPAMKYMKAVTDYRRYQYDKNNKLSYDDDVIYIPGCQFLFGLDDEADWIEAIYWKELYG